MKITVAFEADSDNAEELAEITDIIASVGLGSGVSFREAEPPANVVPIDKSKRKPEPEPEPVSAPFVDEANMAEVLADQDAEPEPTAPEKTSEVTRDDVVALVTEFIGAGKAKEVRSALSAFNVRKASELDDTQLAEFHTALEAQR